MFNVQAPLNLKVLLLVLCFFIKYDLSSIYYYPELGKHFQRFGCVSKHCKNFCLV